VLAEKTLEVDFFKGALQKIEARRKAGAPDISTAAFLLKHFRIRHPNFHRVSWAQLRLNDAKSPLND